MRQLRNLNDLNGFKINARDGAIGKLKQAYFDDRRWMVRYFVVQTGNWLLGQEVLILPAMINGIDDENRTLGANLTCEEVKQSPPVNTQLPVSRHYEQEYLHYYGWQPYWSNDPIFGPTQTILPASGEQPQQPENPHLRSTDAVEGYHLHAQDGEIGHVEDYILDDQDWRVRYLEIDTGHWLPGKKVLISPAWIRKVDWMREEVVIDLPCERIKTAPEYDPTQIISRDYELALYKHYGKSLDPE